MTAKRSSARKTALQAEVTRVYKDAILEAAETVFGEHGFEKAKMVDIAQRAGLAAGTLYNYFESKEQIFQSLIEWRMGQAHERFSAVFEGDKDPRALILLWVKTVLEFIEERRAMVGIFAQMGLASTLSISQICGERAMEQRAEMRNLLQAAIARGAKSGVIRKDVPAAELASLLSGAMNGLIETWMNEGAKGRISDRAGVLVDVFFAGAQKR